MQFLFFKLLLKHLYSRLTQIAFFIQFFLYLSIHWNKTFFEYADYRSNQIFHDYLNCSSEVIFVS